ncbi:MAG: hypothetical protein JXB32_22785 [Deltaproteobacteria bacterium]|nr:hypothetical protein [Deltaproteobacteria bacterium]
MRNATPTSCRYRTAMTLALACTLAGAACQGSDDAAAVKCTRDLALISEHRPCRADDDCPCGAACLLGQCEADCLSNGDCASGEYCDMFGRCRASADDAPIPPLSPLVPGGTLRLATSYVPLTEAETARPVRIEVTGAPGLVRVAADEGLEVTCVEGGPFSDECSFDGPEDGARLFVWVRPTESLAPGDSRTVWVYHGTTADSFSVTFGPTGEGEPPAPDGLTPGRYVGSASLVAVGVGGDAEPPALELAGLTLPLAAELYLSTAGDSGVLVLDDALEVLHPAGRWIGRVAASSPTTATVQFPRAEYLTGEAAAGAPVEVLVEAPAAPLVVGGRSFSFELITRYSGVLMQERKPQVRWLVSLSRTADLPADARAPAVPGDATPALDPARGRNPTAWEAAFDNATTPDPAAVLALPDADKRALLESWGRGGAGTLHACALSNTVADALAGLALRDGWGAESPGGTTRVAPGALTSSGRALVARLATPLAGHPFVAANAVLTSSTSARVLPCRAGFTAVDATFTNGACTPAAETFTFNLGSIDLCDAMAEAYGCEVADSTGETLTVDARLSYEDSAGCVRNHPGFDIVGTVTTVCRMPVEPPSCAEMALCYEPPAAGGTTVASVAAPYLDGATAPLSVSGDLHCASGARSAAIAADVNAELPIGDDARLDAQARLEACSDDLFNFRAVGATTLEPFGSGLREALDAAPACIDGLRLYWALGLATDSDRRRAQTAEAPEVPLASAMAGRLLQQWLLLHAFPAREVAEAERMAQVFRDSGVPGDPTTTPVEEVLDASLRGWDLLLHPRFATALAGLPGSVLAEPDYRPRAAGAAVASQPHHGQTDGPPVAMLAALNAQLALLEPHFEEAALRQDATVLELLGRVLRYALVMRPVAEDLANRAETWAAGEGLARPAWLDRYDGLARAGATTLGRLAAAADAIRSGENPLGIADEDLPLYFFGDEATATRRFSAVSDFLIGTGPGSDAWAPTMVARAEAELEAARTAWLALRERDVQAARDAATLERRLDRIRTRWGEQLYELCGSPSDLMTVQLLEEWVPFNENTCFVRSEDPSCGFDLEGYGRLLSVEQVRYHMCVVRELRRHVGYVVGFPDATLNGLVERLGDCSTLEYPVECPEGERLCLSCGLPGETVLARITPDTFRETSGLDFIDLRTIEDARNACLADFPGVDPVLPGTEDVADSPVGILDCYRGSMGEVVLEIRGLAKDVEIAQSEHDDLYRAYDIAVRRCAALSTDLVNQNSILAAHDSTMTSLRKQKFIADEVAAAASAVKWMSEALDADWKGTGKVAMVLGAVASVAEGAAVAFSLAYQREMDETQQAHELTMARAGTEMAVEQCAIDAEMSLVGLESAGLRIARAGIDVENAWYRLNQMKVSARGIYDDGRLALQRQRDRAVAPLDHDLWLDERIDDFLRDLRLARRLVYLAVRAVEYESQQSLALTGDVLFASRPSQLQTVLNELWTTAATRGVDGRRPTDLKVVLSLREHLLQIADLSGQPETELGLSDVDRFRLLLQSPRHAEFEGGVYRGQRIPFELAPLGTMGLGDAQGIPVLAAHDCAERVWSVNASILGSEELWRGSSPSTYTRVDLLKENTFYSQWCSPGDEPFQTASVRPSRNLFRDPVLGGEYGTSLGPGSEAAEFTRARIEAYFNVDREAFEADDYANGDTSELAARGLYGRYALFIPAEVLAVAGGNGLVLNEVDDILLRLDYVSVAR